MKKNIFISLLVATMGVMALSGCQKNKTCEACKEYRFIYYPNAPSSHLHGNRLYGNTFYGMVMKKNVPNSLKKHPNDTVNICAEIEIQDPVDYSGKYTIKKFNCVIIE